MAREFNPIAPSRAEASAFTVYYRPLEDGRVAVGLVEALASAGGPRSKPVSRYHLDHIADDMDSAQRWAMTVELQKAPTKPSNPAGQGMPHGRLPP